MPQQSITNNIQEFIESLVNVLNSLGIPCVLWGHCLLSVHGIPSIIGSVDFIVPDNQLQISANALLTRAKRLSSCPQTNTCIASSQDRCTAPPAFHLHITGVLDITVGLYTQSDTVWFLPPLGEILPCYPKLLKADSPFVIASDDTVLPPWRPGRGSGVFDAKKQRHPVVALRAAVLLEAFMRLHARDSGLRIGTFTMAMIDYVELYVDEDGLLDVAQLPDPLRSFYQQLKLGEMPVRQWTKELKEALGVHHNDSSD